MTRRTTTATATILAAGAILLGIVGCTGTSLQTEPSASASASTPPTVSASAGAEPTPTPVPSLRPELAASENLAYFDLVNEQVIAADPEAGGRDFVDALVAAGFDKAAMEVTSDTTTIGDRADSIQFAVRFQDECLLGQYGPKSDGYHGAVRPLLGTGGCLVGETRPIDW
jgi:hypothetical protein